MAGLNSDIADGLATVGLEVNPREFNAQIVPLSSQAIESVGKDGFAIELTPAQGLRSQRFVSQPYFDMFNDQVVADRPFSPIPRFGQSRLNPGNGTPEVFIPRERGIRFDAPIFANLPEENPVGNMGDTFGIATKMNLLPTEMAISSRNANQRYATRIRGSFWFSKQRNRNLETS